MAGFAPPPYGFSRALVPREMQTVPWVLLRSHSWPGAYRGAALNAMAGCPGTAQTASFFLPYKPPTGGGPALNAAHAVMSAQAGLLALRRRALAKYAQGLPLDALEAHEMLRIAMPRDSAAQYATQPGRGSMQQVPPQMPSAAVLKLVAQATRARGQFTDPAAALMAHSTRRTASIRRATMSYVVR